MVTKARIFGVFVFVAALLLTVSPMRAQNEAEATLRGTVTDTSGAVVPGAQIVLKNLQTGTTYQTKTDNAGLYTIPEVKPGPGYTLTVKAQGFETTLVSGIYMNVAVVRSQNVQMKVGNVVQTVSVSASNENVTLNTTDATVGNNFDVAMLNELPIEGRASPAALFTQQPGMTQDGSATGARTDQDRVTLDGLDVNDMATGQFGAIVGNAPVDSVQEFRGVEAGGLSTSGAGAGGQFNLVTKGGTNQFHGDLNEYYRDRTMDANTWFSNNSTPQVPRPPLILNQYGGSLGGPFIKNKLLFFFDYLGERVTQTDIVDQTVPLNGYRTGNIAYENASGGLSSISPTQVAAFDPEHIGWNAAVQNIFQHRYPQSNNLNVGDGINTGGFSFDAPFGTKESIYAARLDWNINSRLKLYGTGHWSKENSTESAIQFPGDPETHPFLNNSYDFSVHLTWTITPNMVNELMAGDVTEEYSFPDTYNPTGATQYQTFGGNGTGGAILTPPYPIAINAQGRTYPIPVVRDDFSWQKGKHSFTFGGDFKWPHPLDWTILNYNTPTLGLGGNTPSLASPSTEPSMRPADLASGNGTSLYDSAFALALAPVSATDATFYYNSQLNPIPQGTPQYHKYHYNEAEAYFNDTWKVMPSLTLTYGLQWQFFGVPYDANGIQSITQYYNNPGQKFDFQTYFGDRVKQSAEGVTGNLAVPLLEYVLGGQANHAPSYYAPQYDNFAPKFAFAFTVPGNHNTVINGSANVVYSQEVVNAVQYQQSQFSYLFQSSNPTPYGTPGNAYASFQSDARWGGIANPPAPPPAPVSSSPFLPYVTGTGTNAVPGGLVNGSAFNEIMDPTLKTPYSIDYNLGLQQQLPHGFLLSMTYAARLGRRLVAQADAEQLIDFPDKASGQEMSQAFSNISLEVRRGQPVTEQPWFEDVLTPGVGAMYGFGDNTNLVADVVEPYVGRGDFADSVWYMAALGILPPNVGMASQFSENTMYTNMGFSSYNGLLMTLHKNMSSGLQFDLNYTWSHSIDNTSLIANAVAFGGYGFICNVLQPRQCRGSSDFDVRQNLTGNVIYGLPIGRGKLFASNVPIWANEVVGGWEIGAIPTWHTGNVYNATSNAFVAGYANDAPAIMDHGSTADLKIHLNGGKGQPLYAFTDRQQANADYTGPIGFEMGSRNNLTGPQFFDLDLGAMKTFTIWENVNLNFRADAFNAFNHPNFGTPIVDITDNAGPFGLINTTSSAGNEGGNPDPLSSGTGPRVLQGSLRLQF